MARPSSGAERSWYDRIPSPELRGEGGDSLRILTRDDRGAFERLEDEWDELVDHSDQRVYFLRHRWNQLWWKYFAPEESRLHLIECRDSSNRLVGLAPFYWRIQRAFGVALGRELLFLGMGVPCKTSEYLDVVARRGWEAPVANAVAGALAGAHWDRIWLSQMPSDSTMLPHLARAFDLHVRTEVCDRAPYIDTATDWATFKSRFGRSMRRNVEYYPRRLFKTYPGCEFARVESPAALEPAVAALVSLHHARWRSRGEPGAFSPPFEAFLREAMHDAFLASRLLLWTLKIHGRIEAALVGFLDNGVLHYFQKGFNPAFARDDLGTAMLALAVRDCFDDRRIRRFDFMGGGAQYKDLWARDARENVACTIERPTLGAAMFNAQSRVQDVARALYRRLVPKTWREARRERLRRLRMKHLAPMVAAGLSGEPIATLALSFL